MSGTRNKWFQVRMTAAERDEVERIAESYGLQSSEFIRRLMAHIRAAPMTLDVYPIVPGEPVVGEKERWLQVRVSEEEKETIREVAEMYELDASQLARILLGYFRVVRPPLNVGPSQRPKVGKASAPSVGQEKMVAVLN